MKGPGWCFASSATSRASSPATDLPVLPKPSAPTCRSQLERDPVAMTEPEIPILAGLRDIANRYDGYILDLWGVLHDGQAPLPGVIDCLTRLKSSGKRLVVLSNAPRRAHLVEERVTEIGIPRALYDHLLSSGEEVWRH